MCPITRGLTNEYRHVDKWRWFNLYYLNIKIKGWKHGFWWDNFIFASKSLDPLYVILITLHLWTPVSDESVSL